MKKIENDILNLGVVMLGNVLNSLKESEYPDHPIITLLANVTNTFHFVGYRCNKKKLFKELQEIYDLYNNGELNIKKISEEGI